MLEFIINKSSDGKKTYEDLFHPLAVVCKDVHYHIYCMLAEYNEFYNYIPKELLEECIQMRRNRDINCDSKENYEDIVRFLKISGYDILHHLIYKDNDILNEMEQEYGIFVHNIDSCDIDNEYEEGPFEYLLLPKSGSQEDYEITKKINSIFISDEFAC
ncbi:MAG: hypothetical protein ACRDD8_08215 [Bacteroidales bacterium]